MRKRHLVAAGIVVAVLAVVVSLWVNDGPLWRIVYTKTIPFSEYYDKNLVEEQYGHPLSGWVTVFGEGDSRGGGGHGDTGSCEPPAYLQMVHHWRGLCSDSISGQANLPSYTRS